MKDGQDGNYSETSTMKKVFTRIFTSAQANRQSPTINRCGDLIRGFVIKSFRGISLGNTAITSPQGKSSIAGWRIKYVIEFFQDLVLNGNLFSRNRKWGLYRIFRQLSVNYLRMQLFFTWLTLFAAFYPNLNVYI